MSSASKKNYIIVPFQEIIKEDCQNQEKFVKVLLL